MCFGIGNYTHMSVVHCCSKTLCILWLKHHIFGFPHKAQHFHLCPLLLVIIQIFKCWYKRKRESFILINVFTLLLQDVQQLLLIIYLSQGITFMLLLLTRMSSGCTTT